MNTARWLLGFFVAMLMVGCQDSATEERADTPSPIQPDPEVPVPAQLSFETRTISDTTGCTDSSLMCLTLNISYPEAVDGPEELQYAVNYYLLATIGDQLKGYLDDKTKERELLPLVELVNASFVQMANEFTDEEHNWKIDIHSSIYYTNEKVIVLETRTQDFTGGAHGNRYVLYGNLARPGGDALTYADFVTDMNGFKTSAEVFFRDAQDLSHNAALEAYGYFFEDGVFQLPEQFAFTEKGLLFLYNTYEIGPYSMGIIEFTMPYEQLQGFVAADYLPTLDA